jgi:hypothetical protein
LPPVRSAPGVNGGRAGERRRTFPADLGTDQETVAWRLDDLTRLDEALHNEGIDIEDLRKKHLPEDALIPVKTPRGSSGLGRVTAGRLNIDIKQSTRARKR